VMVSGNLLIISANPLVSTIDLPPLPSSPSSYLPDITYLMRLSDEVFSAGIDIVKSSLIPVGELAFEINNGHPCCSVHA
jgi:hypothetical protein